MNLISNGTYRNIIKIRMAERILENTAVLNTTVQKTINIGPLNAWKWK